VIGKTIGPYEILEKLGAGGMGEVWRARDPRLGRDVAVKFLLGDAATDRDRLRRFQTEARTVSGLNHPNIVTLHEVGESERGPYLVTELVEGRTVRAMLAEGPMPALRALDVAIQAARGLQKAHERGVVHRDIKPENLMLTGDGFVKILDFGLAKLARPDDTLAAASIEHGLTAPGMILGTPAYASPEQLQGQPVDARTDVFALGIVLYEMLSGRHPFRRESAIGTLNAILHEPTPPLPVAAGGIPAELADVVQRAVAKSPEARFASARELEGALQAVRVRVESGAFAPPPAARGLLLRRVGLPLAVAAGAALLFVMFRGLIREDVPIPRPPASAEEALRATRMPIPATPALALPSGETAVVVLPVEDRTGDSMLRDARVGEVIADALGQVLNDVQGLYVISPYRIDAIARSMDRTAAEAQSDDALAREIGTRAGAGALLSGSLSRIGSSYVLSARLVEIPSERVLETFQARSERPDKLLDEVTANVASQMQAKYAREGAGPLDVDRVATSSLEAYAHYVRGDDLVQLGEWDAAVIELQKAVEIDPEMALGWSSLACAFSFAGDDARARAAHLKAVEHEDRLNAMEKRWLDLNGLWIEGASAEAYLAEVKRYIADFPDDRDSYFYAGLAEEYLNGDCVAALEWYERAFALVPGYYPVTKAAVDCYVKLGRKADAVKVLERFAEVPQAGEEPRQRAAARLREIRGTS
jgi:tetratricopeptide (TPR) repeat protein